MSANLVQPNWLERHPILSTILVWIVFITLTLGVAEVGLRFYITYNPGYYTGYKKRIGNQNQMINYPWGKIYVNAEGYPDTPFSTIKTKTRIAYMGDSICYGMGAGHGQRVSEFMEQAFPQFEHLNLANIQEGVPGSSLVNEAKRLQVDTVIYMLNLNDIYPTANHSAEKKASLKTVKNVLSRQFDFLRDKSYLYNFIRFSIKNLILTLGYEVHGDIACERFPHQHQSVVNSTAEQITQFYTALRQHHIKLIIVIVPYEMQISDSAAQTYQKLGIHWENDFLTGNTQQLLQKALHHSTIPILNGYHAFVSQQHPQQDKAANPIGSYFVYNKGDKLDWIHLNAAGHKRLAEFMIHHLDASQLAKP